ncbi:hypothetical protein EVU94_06350 [Flavobacteriaceae bacterium 144Ye]|nr:hypothetical protein EVU94_06350 [Flavobacteriaceae bacterium 144Ye]
MKHIKRRFFYQTNSNDPIFNEKKIEMIDLRANVEENILSDRKGEIAFLELEDDTLIGGLVNKIDGINYLVPIPDPTLIYFNNAQMGLKRISEQRKILISKLNLSSEDKKPPIHELYDFFGLSSGFVIYLFTAIESFINSMIKDDYNYIDRQKNKTIIYNKMQIQESLDFKTKIKVILKENTGKDFFKNNNLNNQLIWKLKEYRDDIIHTKQENDFLRYKNLIKKGFDFKYLDTLKSVAKFMNYYKEDYIIECNCGQDF